jgi:menaquinone-dependent protoporphyrinogen oxidase
MNILVYYGTTEGQTRKIAQAVADRLAAQGHAITLIDAVEARPDLDPATFDAAIVAASLHAGHYQSPVVEFVRRHHDALNAMPTAFVAVSLAAASRDEEDIQGLERCVAEFRNRTQWVPREIHHAAGAFRFSQYDFFKRWAMKFIAYRKGQPTDTSRDYELTDWPALDAFADGFAARIAAT